MNSKQLQNIIYTAAKNNIVTNGSTTFAIQFNNVVDTALSQQNDFVQMAKTLSNYFLSLDLTEIVDNDLVDLKYDKDLERRINETISNLQKIEALSSTQSYLIDYIKKQVIKLSVKQQNIGYTDDSDTSEDIDVNTFIQTFNNILDKQDISSILNFIQTNGFQQLYINQINDGQEPILLFKLIYDEINSKENQELVSQQAEAKSFYKLAISIDDEQLKQNCQFLSDSKIEFPVKDKSTIVISRFKQFNVDLTIGNKTIKTVNDLFTTVIRNEDFISDLNDEEVSDIKKKLLNGLKDATKTLNAVLGFPDIIKDDKLTAEEILNLTINKTVLEQQFNRKFIELIEIFFKRSDVNLYKKTELFDTLYDGVYDDFKEVFDEDIKPSVDTGYKMTENVDLFWDSVVKLQEGLEDNSKIKDCFQKFGETVFNCDNYMISLKILFTFFYNVSGKRTPYMTILYISATMTDDIFGNTWNAISSGIKQGFKNLF